MGSRVASALLTTDSLADGRVSNLAPPSMVPPSILARLIFHQLVILLPIWFLDAIEFILNGYFHTRPHKLPTQPLI